MVTEPTPRRHRLCLECHVVLSDDEGQHYLYHCHVCAMAEHDLARAVSADPDHPEAERLHSGPVDLGLALRPRRAA